MSNSDDELPDRPEGGDATPGDAHRPKKTLLGMGFKLPSPSSLPTAAPAPEEEDFEAEATQMADNLMGTLLEDIDFEMEAAFGLAPLPDIPLARPVLAEHTEPAEEEEFSAEKTQLAAGLRFPQDEVAPEPELGGLQSDSLPMPIRRDDAPEGGGLAEDSLPEPVRNGASTLVSPPGTPRADWRASVPASLLSSRAPLPDGDELPAPIRAEPGASKDSPREDGVDFETEKTELINSPFEQDPSVAKLVTLDGPLVGQEFFASGLRNTIGRGLNNSIVVGDPAMSRQHFEIAKNLDESFTLRDLQSVNGTMLNGTRVREADLYHGDRVEAGKSTFQFMVTGNPPAASRQRRLIPAATSTMAGPMPSPVPAAAARPASNHRLVIALSLAALVVSVLIIAGLALMIANADDAAVPAASAPSASQIYLLGVEAVKARDWDLAETHFTAAAKADPTLAGIPEQLRRIELERAAAKDLALARALVNAGRLEEAKEHVEAIGPRSVYHAEAQEVVRDTRTSEVERLYAEAQAAFTDDDTARAGELVAQILDLVPTHQGAQTLRQRIDETQLRSAEEEKRSEAATVAARGGARDDFRFELVGSKNSEPRARRTQRQPTSGASGSTRVPNFTRGFVLYRTRKFDEAQAFFAEAAAEESPAAALAKKLAGQIAEFKTAYAKGNAAYAAKNWPEADRKLLAAKRADAAISSDAGQFHGELSTKLASVKANLGLGALAANERVEARRYLDQAESFDRDGTQTKQLRAALDKEAMALYVQAVNLRKSDPAAAAKLCRTILQIVPGSDETHQKANKLLKSL